MLIITLAMIVVLVAIGVFAAVQWVIEVLIAGLVAGVSGVPERHGSGTAGE